MAKFLKEFKTTSFLSESLDLSGNLYVKGGIRIDGTLKGQLNSESTVYVGDEAVVDADIVTKSIISSGTVRGTISAEDTVKIMNPGRLEGEVETCNLEIEKDVFFNGKCRLLSPKNNIQPKLATPKDPRKPIPNRD